MLKLLLFDVTGKVCVVVSTSDHIRCDDAESSDDDVVDKTVEEMQQVLVKVPVFNHLHTEEVRKLKLLPIPTVAQHVNTVEDDTDEQILEQFSGGK